MGDGRGCLWWRLFARRERVLQLWVCFRNWRAIVLQKKRRFEPLTAREELEIEFAEDDLALHAIVTCVVDASAQALRFAWIRSIVDSEPNACEVLDRHQRVVLHYALAQRWDDLEQLTWLVAKSERMLLRKDVEGQSLLAQAVHHECPQEVLLLMAVELARRALVSVEALVADRHFESARRLCHRFVEEQFAGVPQFPHAFCRQLLRLNDVLTIVDGLRTVWHEFIDKWGYYGVPILVDDLPPTRQVALDSHIHVSIHAKGEPLVYQWFYQNESIPGATQPTLLISSCVQPHNEGLFYCEATNWKGRVVSSTLQLVVVDDKHGPDPSLRFLLSETERAKLTDDESVRRIAATRGGLVHASLGRSVIMEGCCLLLPPKCFVSFDANGVDVSDSVGMDVVVRPACIGSETVLGLSRSEKLVSIVVDVLPISVPSLASPAILSIPHSWCSAFDPLYELVVVEWRISDNSNQAPKRYQEIERSRILDGGGANVVSFEISRFGRFGVLARSLPSQNKENDKPLEDVVLWFTHTRQLSSGAEIKTVRCGVWLALHRPDALAMIRRLIPEDETMTTSCMRLQLREGQLLHLQLGQKESLSHVWRAVSETKDAVAFDGVVCLREQMELPLHQLLMDPHEIHHDDTVGVVTIFRTLELHVVIVKPNRYQSATKLRANSRNSNTRPVVLPDGLILSEQNWRIHLPVLHDAPQRPPKPTLHQRRPNQLAIAYDRPNDASRITLFEDLHEMERELTPYFYQLELVRFAETFWQRYDRTWWFDKTGSEMLLGMYKVAHSGTEPFTVVASDLFAGVVRVVQCSLDAVGPYSEPLLLEPVAVGNEAQVSVTQSENKDDDDDDDRVPSGVRRELTLAPSWDLSPQRHASLGRLGVVLETVYGSLCAERFEALVGMPRDLETVRVHLERQRDTVRGANREVALLVLVMDRLSYFLEHRVLLRSRLYRSAWETIRLWRRIVPELDCFPTEYAAVTIGLHALVRDLFEIAWGCAAPGWFARLLKDEWLETDLQAIVGRARQLLHHEAQALQGAQELTELFEAFSAGPDVRTGLDMERHALRSLRDYVRLVVGQSAITSSDVAQRELAALLRQFLPASISTKRTREDWNALVAKELESDATKCALQHLREHDTLAGHIRSVSPSNEARFPGPSLPTEICVCFDVHIVHVDTQHALKVANATLRCNVQGQTEFSRSTKRLVFVPALPFDKHTRYQVKVKAQYVHTALGGALPPTATMSTEFFTAA